MLSDLESMPPLPANQTAIIQRNTCTVFHAPRASKSNIRLDPTRIKYIIRSEKKYLGLREFTFFPCSRLNAYRVLCRFCHALLPFRHETRTTRSDGASAWRRISVASFTGKASYLPFDFNFCQSHIQEFSLIYNFFYFQLILTTKGPIVLSSTILFRKIIYTNLNETQPFYLV